MQFDYSVVTDIGREHMFLIVDIVVVLLATAIIARVADAFLNRYFRKMSKNVRIDETQFVILRRLVIFSVYVFGIMIAGSIVPGFSTIGVSLLASAGIIAIVVGFAAQQTFSNVISGIFIAIFEPFRVGDKVTVKDEYGTVEDITLRHTVIRTWQERRLIIPNSKMGEEYITNYSIKDPKILGTLEIGISYDSDIDRARKIMVEEALKHKDLLKKVRGEDNEFLGSEELVKVRLVALTDFSQNMRLYYWAPDQSTSMKMRYDLTESIKKRFDREGIEVPFPYRTIVYKKDMKGDKK